MCVSDTTTVVTLTSQIDQSIERCLFRMIVEENKKLSDRDTQISLVELILDIPAKRSIQSSFLNDSVEEAKTENQFTELLRVSTFAEEIINV